MDTNAIRERWAGRTWRYVERRLGKDKAYLAECTLMVNGRTSGIWLDEPQPVEAEVLAAAAQAPEDVRALLARIDELESMLKAIASHECGDLGPNEAMCISGRHVLAARRSKRWQSEY